MTPEERRYREYHGLSLTLPPPQWHGGRYKGPGSYQEAHLFQEGDGLLCGRGCPCTLKEPAVKSSL